MRRLSFLLPLALAGLSWAGCHPAAVRPSAKWPAGLPVYDHVVIVVEENKNYEQVIGNPAAPYLNGTLRAEGAELTRMFAEEHHSQGNYFWLLSGSNQGVGYYDLVPRRPLASPNLAAALPAAGRTFVGYAEDLPAVGSKAVKSGLYARKHVPWVSFTNVPPSASRRFADWPKDFAELPTVAFVIPNLINDMHDGKTREAVAAGDNWLAKNLDAYYRWAKAHNGLLIVTFDENAQGTPGLTHPGSDDPPRRNRIPTLLAGARVRHGAFGEGTGVTHVNLLRTLEAMYGLAPSGSQQPYALAAGIPDGRILTDVFAPGP
jgi:hypothetical protein